MRRDPYRTAALLTGMSAATDNRYLGRLRERRWRRALVVAIALLSVLTVTAMTRPAREASGWLWIAAAVATALAWILLTLATRNVGSSIDAFADERDRAVRDRAHRLAYWAVGAPLGAIFGAMLGYVTRLAEDAEPVLIGASHLWAMHAVLFVALILFATLPVAIIGWTEPDPPADDFDDPPVAAAAGALHVFRGPDR